MYRTATVFKPLDPEQLKSTGEIRTLGSLSPLPLRSWYGSDDTVGLGFRVVASFTNPFLTLWKPPSQGYACMFPAVVHGSYSDRHRVKCR